MIHIIRTIHNEILSQPHQQPPVVVHILLRRQYDELVAFACTDVS